MALVIRVPRLRPIVQRRDRLVAIARDGLVVVLHDEPQRERQRMLKEPPHILVTTPESFYILLTAEKSRRILPESFRRPIFRNLQTVDASFTSK